MISFYQDMLTASKSQETQVSDALYMKHSSFNESNETTGPVHHIKEKESNIQKDLQTKK